MPRPIFFARTVALVPAMFFRGAARDRSRQLEAQMESWAKIAKTAAMVSIEARPVRAPC